MKKEWLPATLKEAITWEKPTADLIGKAIRLHSKRSTESYLVVGSLLCYADDNEVWREEGIAHDFFEWVEKEHVIARSNAQRMMGVWRGVNKHGLLDKYLDLILSIDFSRIVEIAPLLLKAPEQEAADLLHAASVNSVRDLRNNIKEAKGKLPDDKCDHIRLEVYHKCVKCGRFFSQKTEVVK